MKILSPKEYKVKNPNAFLGDYLTYLENAQKEAEESLNYAKTLLSDESIIGSIQKQAEDIFQMAMIVEEYMGMIILKTVDTLSLVELQSYFNFDIENRIDEEKKSELEKTKNQVKEEIEKVEKQISDNLFSNGRVRKFYESDGAEVFFAENETPYAFLENLLSSYESLSFEEIAEELQGQLKQAILTECDIQKIEMANSEVEIIINKIMELVRKCKNILTYSPAAKEQLSKILLSDSGIKSLLPDSFDENTALYLVYELMNDKKYRTNFFINLPISLKTKLINTRLIGEPYDTLTRTYQAFLDGTDLPIEDLNQDENNEKKRLEGELERINNDLNALDVKKQKRDDFLQDEEAMRSVLRKSILDMIGNHISVEKIDEVIKEEEEKIEELRTVLLDASNLLDTKISDLNKAQEILIAPDYHNFFQAVELNNVRRLYRFFGVNVTDEYIKPFLDEEIRRLSQIELMINLQNGLIEISDEIKNKKDRSNFITRNLSSYKESLQALEDKYKALIEQSFSELKEKGLIYIDVPQISDESTIGNIIVLPSEQRSIPEEFGDLSGIRQTFWNMSTGIDENTKKRILAKSSKFDNWDDYYKDLMANQARLVSKLFSFGLGTEGYYNFTSSKEERETLIEIQKTIIEILSSVYKERKAFRESLGTSNITLDDSKVQELECFLGKGANLSRENLANYIEQTRSKIEELKTLLAENYTMCVNLGITLPDDITAEKDASAEDIKELEERIKALDIDGVTTLDDAIAYRNLLLGLEEYIVPEDEVKKFYLSHKN